MANKTINELPTGNIVNNDTNFAVQHSDGTTENISGSTLKEYIGGGGTLEETLILGNETNGNNIVLSQGDKIINSDGDYGIQLGLNTPVSTNKLIAMGDVFDLSNPPTTGILNNILIGGNTINQSDIVLASRNLDDNFSSIINLKEGAGAQMVYSSDTNTTKVEALSDNLYLFAESVDGSSSIMSFAVNQTDNQECRQTISSKYHQISVFDNGQQFIDHNIGKNQFAIQYPTYQGPSEETSLFTINSDFDGSSSLVYDIKSFGMDQMNFKLHNMGIDIQRKHIGNDTFVINKTDGGKLSLVLDNSYIDFKSDTLELSSDNVNIISSNLTFLEGMYYKNDYQNGGVSTISPTTIFSITDWFPGVDGVFLIKGVLTFTDIDNGNKAVYEVKHYTLATGSGSTYTSIGTPEMIEVYNNSVIDTCVWDFSSSFGPLIKAQAISSLAYNADYNFNFTIERS